MKYMKLNIRISNRNKDVWVLIFLQSISREASRVQLYLSSIPSRIERDCLERFDIYSSWNENIAVEETYLSLPYIRESSGTMIDVNRGVEIRFDNEIRCEEFLSRLVEALHFWDKRCERSVRVREKMKVDFPINLYYGEECIEIIGKQMLEFAKYIQP